MNQLYARVFTQILDSSIAEDFTLRHIFEDFLKLCDFRTGIVDMTRTAMARRLNVPLELLNDCIEKLESPDPSSRDKENDGRRLVRLDEHRDWGWKIVNWEKYDKIRARASNAERAARYRDKHANNGKPETEAGQQQPPEPSWTKPDKNELLFAAEKMGLPSSEVEKFWNFYEAKGWMIGKNKMRSPNHALANWKLGWETNRKPPVENQI